MAKFRLAISAKAVCASTRGYRLSRKPTPAEEQASCLRPYINPTEKPTGHSNEKLFKMNIVIIVTLVSALIGGTMGSDRRPSAVCLKKFPPTGEPEWVEFKVSHPIHF